MEDTKKLIEKYKRELMELSKTAPRPEPREQPSETASEEPPKSPKVIGYVTEESGEFPEVFDRFIAEAVENNDIDVLPAEAEADENAFPDDTFDVQDAPPAASDREMMQGTGESISNFSVPEYSTMEEFEANNTGGGMLEFRVFTAREALPVEGAQIIVTVRINGEAHEMYKAVTDSSGETQMHTLPTPSKELSQNAENRIQPFSLYDASVEKEGFTKVILRDIPMFDGVRSIQRVAMIPEAENADGSSPSEEIIDETTEVPNAK